MGLLGGDKEERAARREAKREARDEKQTPKAIEVLERRRSFLIAQIKNEGITPTGGALNDGVEKAAHALVYVDKALGILRRDG